MNNLKIGDIVRAKKRESGGEIYAYTNSTVRCRVVDRNLYGIKVEILDGRWKGEIYLVEEENFYKISNRTE